MRDLRDVPEKIIGEQREMDMPGDWPSKDAKAPYSMSAVANSCRITGYARLTATERARMTASPRIATMPLRAYSSMVRAEDSSKGDASA